MASMKTTIDLPDELLRQVKICAAEDGRKLKDLLAEIIERGLESLRQPATRARAPKPIRARGASLTIVEIESAIAAGRD